MTRIVFGKGKWPENNYADFEVFPVGEAESDEEAIARAAAAYCDGNEFYVRDDNEPYIE